MLVYQRVLKCGQMAMATSSELMAMLRHAMQGCSLHIKRTTRECPPLWQSLEPTFMGMAPNSKLSAHINPKKWMVDVSCILSLYTYISIYN
jgi:hypothetical protein